MKALNKKIAVIFYGSPGSGKGTQAKLLAEELGLYHFDTGDFLRKMIYDPKLSEDKTIQREKELNESGKLQTPSFVFEVVSRRILELMRLGQSLVFSGSPRTFYEAFEGKDGHGLYDILEKEYGKKGIYIFALDISEEESIKRNVSRAGCAVCNTPLLAIDGNKYNSCPFCGGKIEKRIDDDPETMKIRLKEYKDRTMPIFEELKKRKYQFFEIDGTPVPYKIHEKVLSLISS